MNNLPKRLYFIKIFPGGPGLHYAEKGGGKYTEKGMAISQLLRLRRRGSNAKLYETETDWREVEIGDY